MDYRQTSAPLDRRVRRAGVSAAAGALLLIGSVAGWTAAGSGFGSASAAPSAPAVSTAAGQRPRTAPSAPRRIRTRASSSRSPRQL